MAAPRVEWVRIVRGGKAIEIGSERLDLETEDLLTVTPEQAQLLTRAGVAERITPARAPTTT